MPRVSSRIDFPTAVGCSTQTATWLVVLLVAGPLAAELPVRESVAPRAARQELDRQFAERLEQLAERCEQLGLADQAGETRNWFIPRDPRRDYLFLPRPWEAPNPGAWAEPTADEASRRRLEQFWELHFRAARRQQAERLFALARQSAPDYPAEAYSLLHEVLHEDPQHEAARRILGFRKSAKGWSRPGDVVGVTRGRTPQPAYQFAARQYHQVTTAHFRLLTDADPEEARQVAQRLEDLQHVWRQVFFLFWNDGTTLARRIESETGDFRARTDKYQVVWFRDRARYFEVLQREEPLIEKTLGIYLDKKRIAFLFGDPQEMLPSWLHEVTHQLFAETVRTSPDIGGEAHMWVAEGVALHLESLRWFPGYCLLGGFDADRLQYARYRALAEGNYVPLAELTRMGRRALQQDPRIGALYSQAAGLTDFLMNGRARSHRQAFLEYLKSVYMGRAALEQLAALTETPLAELDEQYLEHLRVDDQQLAFAQPVANLFLGHCPVTDQGWSHVPVERLEWLDVGFTSITDAGATRLADARRLKKLTLEHTPITRRSLPVVATLDQLEYLDLSGLDIRDEDLPLLSGLKKLESLWLTGTQVTDDGLRHLRDLPRLETLDVSQTKVTPTGWQNFQRE